MLYSEATPGSGRGLRGVTGRPRSRCTTAARCSGVVPQHPPTRARPNCSVNVACASASWAGVSGYRAPSEASTGRPALGMQDSGMRACPAR